MRFPLVLTALLCATVCTGVLRAADGDPGSDPYWVLLHEPGMVEELALTTEQQAAYQKLVDGLDQRFFPLRNKSTAEARAGIKRLNAEAAQQLKALLKPPQAERMYQIQLWRDGIGCLLRDDVAQRLNYTEAQRKKIKTIIDETQSSVKAIEKQIEDGQPHEPLETKYKELKTEEQTNILKLLKANQRTAWKEVLGRPFDLSALGHAQYKAPELIDSHEWIGSQPLTLKKLRGKVVVVHFYASNCINCIHNYPSYREWSGRFKGQDVVIIGIHTPETEAERNVAQVRQKAAAERFTFPVLIDVKSENWNAWGNSIWPSVYVIDKAGYLRQFWSGELKWNGADGEKFLRHQIEQLLLEESESP